MAVAKLAGGLVAQKHVPVVQVLDDIGKV